MRHPAEIPGIDDRYLQAHGPFNSFRDLGRHIGLKDAMTGGKVTGAYVDLVFQRVGGTLSTSERAALVLGLMEGFLDYWSAN
jgi:hypothetical protein